MRMNVSCVSYHQCRIRWIFKLLYNSVMFLLLGTRTSNVNFKTFSCFCYLEYDELHRRNQCRSNPSTDKFCDQCLTKFSFHFRTRIIEVHINRVDMVLIPSYRFNVCNISSLSSLVLSSRPGESNLL